MTIYHGGYQVVEAPQIIEGEFAKDFGCGFYCTEIREQFWVLAKFKYPTHQINFCTPQSLQCLTFKGCEEVKNERTRR